MQPAEICICTLVALLSWAILLVLRSGRRGQGLPPGPPTIPLLGNAHMLGEGKDVYLKVAEWARYYGDIYSLKIGGGTMVVLSSATAIKQVVDKGGWAGSSRPENYIAEVCGSGSEFNILFADDCPRFKNLRRIIARFFSPQNSLKYVPAQAAESTLLLHDLITRPADFSDSIRRYTHSLAKIIAYGERAPSFRSSEVQRYYTSLDQLVHALAPGAYPPFDLLPVLKYLPAAFAPWRAVGHQIESVRTGIHTKMYESLRRRQAAGDEESTECFVGKLFQSGVPAGEEQFYSYSGLSLLDAGSDTTGAFLLSLVLILATYPECQARARKEIDAIVGGARLPVPADFPKLPYLDALIKETLRFRPQLPMGVPHLMGADAFYKDYLVPKGAVVVLNTFALLHDPEIFEDPEVFNPDRFLKSEHGTRPGMDTDFRDNFHFGGGRRICPGQWIAGSTMQLTAMRLIWAFNFSTAASPRTGAPISQDLNFYASDFIVMPRPFKCTIEPRSAEHCEVVIQALENAKLYLNRYENK
ncbi:cytochrome P450 [Mycena rosella]|uniref:Cytochrome P450 n=1 Tax=Mycena rosella TaxID=1033263 RepID=A0AAD7GUC0_MYCRO|nr:cytochrome P450 [Mycena rosella]